MDTRVHFASSGKHWATPAALFDRIHAQYGFTLDVCATADNAKLPRFFSPEQNGLMQSWRDERCWMNPPYGRAIANWVRKAAAARATENALVVALLPARTDTGWWHEYVHEQALVRFLRGRITVEGAAAPAPFPSVLAVWGSGTMPNVR